MGSNRGSFVAARTAFLATSSASDSVWGFREPMHPRKLSFSNKVTKTPDGSPWFNLSSGEMVSGF